MNKKHTTIGFIASIMLIGSTAVFAADDSPNTSLESGTPQTATVTPVATETRTPPVATEIPATAAPAPTETPAPAAPARTETPATATPASETPPVATKTNSINKPLAKVTCEEFLTLDEVIQTKYVIAAEPYAKAHKPKSVVIDVVATETLVPVLIEECTKAPKDSFLTKLKSKLKR